MNQFCARCLQNLNIAEIVIAVFILILPFLERIDFCMRETIAGGILFLGVILAVVYCFLFYSCLNFSRLDLWVGLGFIVYLFYAGFNSRSVGSLLYWQTISLCGIYFLGRQVRSWHKIIKVFFISAVIQSIWGILQQMEWLVSGHMFFTATGGFPNPGIWGGFLSAGSFAGIYWWKRETSFWKRIIIGGMLLLVGMALLLSASRAAWLSLLVGVIIVLWEIKGFKQWRNYSPGREIFCLMIAIMSGLIIVIGLYYLRPESADGRLLIWQVATEIFEKAPFLGQGIGSFESCYMPAQAEWLDCHLTSPLTLLAGDNLWAFNEYIRIGCETGILGLLFLVLYFIVGIQNIPGSPAKERIWIKSTLSCLSIFACFSYPFSFLSFQVIVIMIFACIGRQNVRLKLLYWERIIGIVVLFFLCWKGEKNYIINYRADRFLNKQHNISDDQFISEGTDFYLYLFDSPDFVTCYARQLYLRKCYAEALPILNEAFRLRPCSELAGDLGNCLYQNGQKTAAEKAFLSGCRMVPGMLVPRYRLFCFYRDIGRDKDARNLAKILLSMPVKLVNTRVLAIRQEIRNYLTTSEV